MLGHARTIREDTNVRSEHADSSTSGHMAAGVARVGSLHEQGWGRAPGPLPPPGPGAPSPPHAQALRGSAASERENTPRNHASRRFREDRCTGRNGTGSRRASGKCPRARRVGRGRGVEGDLLRGARDTLEPRRVTSRRFARSSTLAHRLRPWEATPGPGSVLLAREHPLPPCSDAASASEVSRARESDRNDSQAGRTTDAASELQLVHRHEGKRARRFRVDVCRTRLWRCTREEAAPRSNPFSWPEGRPKRLADRGTTDAAIARWFIGRRANATPLPEGRSYYLEREHRSPVTR